ncbi:MAG: hypothetical protein AAFX39_01305 [Pseudomonadota bacterium]
MTKWRGFRCLTLWLVAAYAMASLGLGLSATAAPDWRSAGQDRASTIDLSAYALPDGTIPEICLWADPDASSDPHSGPHCDACLLSLAALAPVSGNATWLAAPQTEPITSIRDTAESLSGPARDLALSGPRAPPTLA